MLNKKECENALYELSLITAKDTEDGSCLGCSCTSCLPNDECLNGKLIGTFKQLIKEHFDNPPHKFEELKPDMWVWDRK